ncbi:capsular polysaccharide biosynthesis heptosyltransferase hddD [Vibrio ishigakensis]|uniref:Capsular polysaccharide biosynthesis heptosyltransferase hddD n=1 Tax=Vibrio ishigakensis TaxID=1481914 RepID=A0A0B8PJL6_9VIBR|nr:capsular polysaccharide biosynthesis heptosyltransferase hddD [Vibrio ishigakensis]
MVDTLKTSSKYSLKDAFNEIGFSDNVNSLLNLAKQSINKDTVAIHLRTGDVLYGQYRKFVNYTYKGLCLPLVEKIIKDEILLGNNIVLFGQESGVLNHLKEKYNVTISDDLVPNHISDSTELAIFEMALMSNCKSIIAGSSGFAKISSRIGNIKLEPGFRRYRAAEQTEFILQHLSNCDSHYNDNHSAFSYWYAYFYGRQNKSNRESIDILKKASHFDPNNEVYKLIMFFLANESENKKETNYLAKEIIDAGFTKLSIEGSSYKSILTSRTTGKLNLNEYISKFRYDKANETYDQFGHELCSMIDETLKELN